MNERLNYELTRREALRLLLGATAGLAIAGCGGNSGESATNGTSSGGAETGGPTQGTAALPKQVTIAYNPVITQPQPLLGLEGEYKSSIKGVEFVGKEYKAGPDVIEALRSGVAEIGSSGAWPAIKAFAKDKDIIMLAGCAVGGTQLTVAKNSPVKTVQDLKGKTIAVNQIGSNVEALVRLKLVEAGLDPERDVKIVAIEPADQAAALEEGDVAAAAAPPPWPSFAEQTTGARALLNSKQIYNNGNYLQGTLYTTKRFADANPEFLKQFLQVNRRITDEINRDRAKADARILAAWSKVTGKRLKPEVAKAAFATLSFTTDVSQAGLQKFADDAAKVNVLKKKADLNGFVYTP